MAKLRGNVDTPAAYIRPRRNAVDGEPLRYAHQRGSRHPWDQIGASSASTFVSGGFLPAISADFDPELHWFDDDEDYLQWNEPG